MFKSFEESIKNALISLDEMDRGSPLALFIGHWDDSKGVFEFAWLFFKYLFDKKIKSGSKNSIYEAFNIIIPEHLSWENVERNPTEKGLIETIQEIEGDQHNKFVQDVFSCMLIPEKKNADAREEIIKEMINRLSTEDFSDLERAKVVEQFDLFIKLQQLDPGMTRDKFSTHPDVINLMVEVINPHPNKTIYDPFCGTGGLLLSAGQYASRKFKDSSQVKLFGQDVNPKAIALAKLNFLLHDFYTAEITENDTLSSPMFVEKGHIMEFDYVLSHPPSGITSAYLHLGKEVKDIYGRYHYGWPQHDAGFGIIQHVLASMNKNGKGAILLRPDLLYTESIDFDIRKKIIEADLIETVIRLPKSLFHSLDEACFLLFLNKNKEKDKRKNILCIYATEEKCRDELFVNIKDISETTSAFQEKPGFARIVSLDEISQNNYNLIPANYLNIGDISKIWGGTSKICVISELGEVFSGTRIRMRPEKKGSVPVIQSQDLSKSRLLMSDLTLIEETNDGQKPLLSEIDDVLIQGTGETPKSYLVDEELKGIILNDTVHLIRLFEDKRHLAHYLIEFLNSEKGQGLLKSRVIGVSHSKLRKEDLRSLPIPIPDEYIYSLFNDIRQTERDLEDRMLHALSIRQKLFNLEDKEEFTKGLSDIKTKVQVLKESLIQVDDLDFQVRNFFPFPLAFGYRSLNAITAPIQLYPEQLRVAENVLAFLACIGLVMVCNAGLLSIEGNPNLTKDTIMGYWHGGISPGDWKMIAQQTGGILRGNSDTGIYIAYSNLWYRAGGRRASEFSKNSQEMVKLKNDFKHDRGPRTPDEFRRAVNHFSDLLFKCFEQISFFIQYPIRLIEDVDTDWQTKEAILDTRMYMGDHPGGLRREETVFPRALSKDKLYIEIDKDDWALLYPLISIHYCPVCGNRATFFIDHWDGPGDRIVLKSFERGHTLYNDENAKIVGRDLEHWMEQTFT